jgi:hypothetical protein
MDLVNFHIDLYGHELERVAITLAAAGHTMDLVTMHADEADAHRMLYTDLTAQQRFTYRQLHAHDILGHHA